MFLKLSINIFILKGKFLKQLNSFGEKRREKKTNYSISYTGRKAYEVPLILYDMKKVNIVAGKSLPGVKSTFITPHDMTFIIVLKMNFHMNQN